MKPLLKLGNQPILHHSQVGPRKSLISASILKATKSVGMWGVHYFHLVPKSPTLGPKPRNTSYTTVRGAMKHFSLIKVHVFGQLEEFSSRGSDRFGRDAYAFID